MNLPIYHQKVLAGAIRVWIFQANPKIFNFDKALNDPEYKIENWLANQYLEEMHFGDLVLFWKSGERRGIYAFGGILSDVYVMLPKDVSPKYWIDKNKIKSKQAWVDIKVFINLSQYPIFAEELKDNSILKELSILKFAQQTNFAVTIEEWSELYKLIARRLYPDG